MQNRICKLESTAQAPRDDREHSLDMTFEEFLPEYLEAHADRRTRVIHAAGTMTALAIATAAIARRQPSLVLAALAAGYVPAWLSHWIFEGNQPKTFEYPLLSLRGDFVMAYRTLRGQLT